MEFPELRPFQAEAIQSIQANPHTVLIAPTGSGKSLVFQKYLHDSRARTRAILVSPLNALGRQIARGLEESGVPVSIGIGREGTEPPAQSGVWILSPEKLLGSAFEKARNFKPNLLIVDEAHCVWEWGDQFRPEFSLLPALVSRLKIAKSFWCSATLPKPALLKITDGLNSSVNILGKFAVPPNLEVERLQVSPHRKLQLLRSLLDSHPLESGIIFVSTRVSAERVQFYLSMWAYPAIFYHAGMSSEERIGLEQRLSRQNPKSPIWVVATSAFGMGMNYPFLRRCIVFDPSLSLLSLAQALGRVGRGSASARASVMWHENDFRSLEAMMEVNSERRVRLAQVKTWCMTQSDPATELEKYFNEG
jgi:ATP-dependent DNA helicase RecQ